MIFKSAILVLACSLYYLNAQSSQDVLSERLKSFNGFYATRVKEIYDAGANTKTAVAAVSAELEELLAMVISEFDSMGDKNKVLEEAKTDLENSNKVMVETVDHMNGTITKMTDLTEKLKQSLKQHKDIIKSQDKENADILGVINEMKKESSNLKKSNEELKDEVKITKEEKTKCDDGNKKLEEMVNNLKGSKDEMTESIENLNATIIRITTEKTVVQKELEQTKGKCQRHGEENLELLGKMKVLHDEIGNLTAQNAELQQKIAFKNIVMEEMTERIHVLQNKDKTQDMKISTLQEKLKNDEVTIGKLKKEIQILTIEVEISRGGYEMLNGRYVKYFNRKMTWESAKVFCESSSSQLITVKDGNTTEWLKSYYQPMWIGASDLGHEGNWTWVDGTQVEDGNWNVGEPNNGMGTWFHENCAAVNFQTFPWWSYGKWADRACSKKERFACEIPNYP